MILESEDFSDADVFMEPPNKANGQLSHENSDAINDKGKYILMFNIYSLSADQLRAPVDFRINFGSYIADSILTQKEKLHNFDEEECGSKDEPSNSINLANEKIAVTANLSKEIV